MPARWEHMPLVLQFNGQAPVEGYSSYPSTCQGIKPNNKFRKKVVSGWLAVDHNNTLDVRTALFKVIRMYIYFFTIISPIPTNKKPIKYMRT